MNKARPPAPKIFSYVSLVMLAMLYLPLVMLVSSAIKLDSKWYIELINDRSLLSAALFSFIVALSSSLISTVLGSGIAISIYENQRKWFSVLLNIFASLSLVLPEIVFALSLVNLFFLMHFQLGFLSVLIAHITFSTAYVVLTVGARFNLVEPSLKLAAYDLGASESQYLRRVLIPNLWPGIVSGLLLCFVISFDDFLITYFVNGAGQDTLPVKLYSALKTGMNPKITALSFLIFVFSFLPISLYLKINILKNKKVL